MSEPHRDDEIPLVSVREIRQLQDFTRNEVVPLVDSVFQGIVLGLRIIGILGILLFLYVVIAVSMES
jgi:hypothetical protein